MTLIFGTLVLVTLASLVVQMSWSRCHGMDPAGCGMSQAFNAMIAQALALVTGLLASLFLVPRCAARATALALLVPLTVLSAVLAANVVEKNLRVTGTVTGRDPAR